MPYHTKTVIRSTDSNSILANNAVIRNTYILLSLSLIFSAATAYLSMILRTPPLGFMALIGYIGLFFLVHALKNSALGIVAVFALTGFMGFTLGPILNMVMQLSNGAQIISSAFGLTGAIFLALSGYALTTKKDFSYMAGFLFAAITIAFVASIVAIFFNIPGLHLLISCAFVLISSGYILYETSQIVNGGERNYIMATVALYVQIYNLFISLLHILTSFAGNRD